MDDLLVLAGFPAAWTRFVVDVREDHGGTQRQIPCEPLDLYALADADRAIDAVALLRERVIADPPYWALVWTGARAIAAVVSAMPAAPAGRVLDLGCGLGFAGIAAARRGAAVTFGDYLDAPMEFVRASLSRLGLERCRAGLIDFTRAAGDEHRFEPDIHDLGHFDLILAADIVYDPAHYRPLAEYLDLHLAPGGTILLTESLRADASVFLDGLLARGFEDDKRALWVMEDGRRERTWLHRLARTAA